MTLIRLRGGTEYEWSTADPTLAAREVGVTTDTHRLKVGDGVTAWSSLPWVDAVAVAAGLPTGGTTGQLLTKDSGTDYDASWSTVDLLPSQTGNNGKYLSTNGSVASWQTVDSFPSQTSNAGKYLTTDGSATAWGSPVVVSDDPPASPTTGTIWVDADSVATVPGIGYISVAENYAATSADSTIGATATLTVTLPAAATVQAGRVLTVKNAGTGAVTVDGYASETIDGELTQTLSAGDSLAALCTGTGWLIV